VLGWSGIGVVVGFVLLRLSNLYGDPGLWSVQGDMARTLMSFLRVNKYPPSLLYLMMTLGPALAWLAYSDERRGKVMAGLAKLGEVPLFYYLLHLPLLHGAAVVAAYWNYGEARWLLVDQLMLTAGRRSPCRPILGMAWWACMGCGWQVWRCCGRCASGMAGFGKRGASGSSGCCEAENGMNVGTVARSRQETAGRRGRRE
jgi:hypothetical protein